MIQEPLPTFKGLQKVDSHQDLSDNETLRQPTPVSRDGSGSTAFSSNGDLPMISSEKLSPPDSERSSHQSSRDGIEKADITEYPTGLKLTCIVIALCLGILVMSLDNSIIATAIPTITNEFHSLEDVGWYGSAYLLTTASLQLLFGKFYTFYSIKKVYLFSITVFEIGSLICGVSRSSAVHIVGRAVSGVGAAGIFTGTFSILAYTVPLHKRAMYTSTISSIWGVSNVAGPLVGGIFTDKVTWRWGYYINLPIGAITVLVIALFFPDPKRDIPSATLVQRLKQIDPLGNLLFMPSVVCLLLALQWGGTSQNWREGRVIGLLVVSGVLFSVFLGVQSWLQDAATVPPRIMKMRNVWTSSIYIFNLGAGYLVSVYYLPIWFQAVKGESAMNSGLMNLPLLIGVVILSLVAGFFVTKFGHYAPFMILGTVFMAVGYGLLTTFKVDTNMAVWIGFQAICGAGVGFGMQQPLMAVQVVLDIEDVPTGTAIIVFLQTLGGAIFVSVAQAVFSSKLASSVAEHVPSLNLEDILRAGATGLQSTASGETLKGLILSYNEALTSTFMVSAITASLTVIGSVLVEWKSLKQPKVKSAGSV